MHDLMTLVFAALAAGCSASPCLADSASTPQDPSSRSAQMSRPQRTFTLSDESSVSGLMAAAPQGRPQISGFDILKANATSATSSVQDLSNRSAQMARPQRTFTLSDESSVSGLMAAAPQRGLQISGFDILKANATSATSSVQDLSDRSAQMARPQRTFTLSDESSVSGLMAAAPQGRLQISGFDILKASATSATSSVQDLSNRSAQMARPQRTFTLSDESSVSGLMAAAPQGRLQISGFDILKASATSATSSVQDLSNRSAQMARPQRPPWPSFDETAGSGLMHMRPQSSPLGSGFDIIKPNQQTSQPSEFDLSSRVGLAREEVLPK